MVFCNNKTKKDQDIISKVTILILIDGFLQFFKNMYLTHLNKVTILILIDGFLQLGGKMFNILVFEQSQSLF